MRIEPRWEQKCSESSLRHFPYTFSHRELFHSSLRRYRKLILLFGCVSCFNGNKRKTNLNKIFWILGFNFHSNGSLTMLWFIFGPRFSFICVWGNGYSKLESTFLYRYPFIDEIQPKLWMLIDPVQDWRGSEQFWIQSLHDDSQIYLWALTCLEESLYSVGFTWSKKL